MYLGFNDQGSWIESQNDRKIYIWNLQNRTLIVGAENRASLSTELILSLRNSQYAEGMLSDRGIRVANNEPQNNPAPSSAQPSVPAAPSVPMGASRQTHGSGAKIAAGVLTFTVNDVDSPDNGKQMKYKVTRGAMSMNPNAPAQADANSIAGQWVGDDPKDKDGVLLFYVQPNGTVAMQAFSGMTAVMMKRMAGAAPQQ